MTDVIIAQRGTIDKYMGDCIMAFWNAPLDDADHAGNACRAALAMRHALTNLNRELEQESGNVSDGGVALRVGIGLNSGPCVVGNMGSAQRFDYSVLGDAVNLASRLEGQSKFYGVDIVLGEETQQLVREFACLELDLIAVKGKQEAVKVFALVGDPALAKTPAFQALAREHAAMIELYRCQDWAETRRMIERCRAANPAFSDTYALYASRVARLQSAGVDPGWAGVHVAESK